MADAFPIHDQHTAPPAAADVLRSAADKYGTIPNLEGVMAAAPALLDTYEHGTDRFARSSLSRAEQEVVAQTVNVENGCDYCVPWHTHLSEQTRLSDADVEALRDGDALSTPKLEALRHFTTLLVQNHGSVSEDEVAAFLEAGYTPQQVLEVVLGIALKVMSNYTNAIADPPLDDRVQEYAWPAESGEPGAE